MEPPKEKSPQLTGEVERLLVDVMRMYGDETKVGGSTMWDTNDGSGDSYELQEFPSRDGSFITYTITRKDIVGARTMITPLRWSQSHQLHVPTQPLVEGEDNSTIGRHIAALQILQDNYEALLTADIAIQPYQRPHDGKIVDIHEEFESLVAYTIDHLSYEHLADNYRSVAALKRAHSKKKQANHRTWRVPQNILSNKFTAESEDSSSE